MSKQERRRAETAIKRQKMLEEERKEKDKVKDRLDLIRQIKGDINSLHLQVALGPIERSHTRIHQITDRFSWHQ